LIYSQLNTCMYLTTEFVQQEAGGSTIDVFNPFRHSEVRAETYHLLTEVSVWETLDRGREYRLKAVRSVHTTNIKIR